MSVIMIVALWLVYSRRLRARYHMSYYHNPDITFWVTRVTRVTESTSASRVVSQSHSRTLSLGLRDTVCSVRRRLSCLGAPTDTPQAESLVSHVIVTLYGVTRHLINLILT